MSRTCVCFAIASGLALAPSYAAQTDTSTNVLGYELPRMRDVTVRRAISYSTRGLTMDVYTPTGAAQQRPALVFVHGGLVAGQSGLGRPNGPRIVRGGGSPLRQGWSESCSTTA